MENGKFRYLSELHREEAEKLRREEKGALWKALIVGASLAGAIFSEPPLQQYLIFVSVGAIYAAAMSEIRIARMKAHLDNISLHRFMASDYD